MSFLEATMSENWHLGTKGGAVNHVAYNQEIGSVVVESFCDCPKLFFTLPRHSWARPAIENMLFYNCDACPMKAMKTNEDKRDRTCTPRWKQADWEVSQSPCTVGICWYHWLFLSPSDIPKSPAKTPIFSTWFLHFQSSWADASWRMEPEARWRAVSKGVNRHEISLSIIIG